MPAKAPAVGCKGHISDNRERPGARETPGHPGKGVGSVLSRGVQNLSLV